MTEYDNTNRGSIWKNEKQETEKHPDFTGSLNVNGVDFWVSAWKRKPDANPKAPALSFSIKQKDVQTGGGETAGGSDGIGGDLDGDTIPFVTRWGYL